jgi:hypothetical protein
MAEPPCQPPTEPEGPGPDLRPALLSALSGTGLVNLTGPLGSGKSWLVRSLLEVLPAATTIDLATVPGGDAEDLATRTAQLLAQPGEGPVILDNAEGPSARSVLARLERVPTSGAGHRRPLLVVTRRPVLALPGWSTSGAHVIALPAWEDQQIQEMAQCGQVGDAGRRDLVVRLAAGNPMVADVLCRALHSGVPAAAPGALADQVSQEIHQRLAREDPAPGWQQALADLATVWSGTLELLRADREVFDTLAGLSLVNATDLGLTLTEPYRTLIEMSHRWRMPARHRTVRTRALSYRMGQLGAEPVPQRRGVIGESILALSQDRTVRDFMFPSGPEAPAGSVRTATTADSDEIGALMHGWARQSGLDTHRAERMLERWLRDDPTGIRLIRDRSHRATGFATVLRASEATMNSVEPLLQRHVQRLRRPAGELDGFVVTNVYSLDRAAVAALLRHLMRYVLVQGKPVAVTTQTPDYQELLRSLHFEQHGEIHELFRGGRRPQVYSHDFGAVPAADWLREVATGTADRPTSAAGGQEVAEALSCLNAPDAPEALAGCALAARLAPASGTQLERQLREALQDLANSQVPVDAQAGWILLHYYLGREMTHGRLIRRLDLSRATYFRRYRYGLGALGRMLTVDVQDLSA